MLGLIRKKISDRRTLRLMEKIVKAYATSPGKGMPLGALTSQLFANVYLDPLDHFIKERLGAKFYLRYLDDFVILHDSRQQLERYKSEIEQFAANELKLGLHPQKTSILPLHHGVRLLGFRIFGRYRLLKKPRKHYLAKFASLKESCDSGAISSELFERKISGWMAHACWGDTYKMRMKIRTMLFSRRTPQTPSPAPRRL